MTHASDRFIHIRKYLMSFERGTQWKSRLWTWWNTSSAQNVTLMWKATRFISDTIARFSSLTLPTEQVALCYYHRRGTVGLYSFLPAVPYLQNFRRFGGGFFLPKVAFQKTAFSVPNFPLTSPVLHKARGACGHK